MRPNGLLSYLKPQTNIWTMSGNELKYWTLSKSESSRSVYDIQLNIVFYSAGSLLLTTWRILSSTLRKHNHCSRRFGLCILRDASDIWLLESWLRSKKVLIEWVYRKLSLIYISASTRKCNCNCHLYCPCECSCKCCCTCSIKCERECKSRRPSRNLVVSIDGTSNQFGLFVSRRV